MLTTLLIIITLCSLVYAWAEKSTAENAREDSDHWERQAMMLGAENKMLKGKIAAEQEA